MNKEVSAIIFDLGGVILNLDYHLTINAFQAMTSVDVNSVYTQANQVDVFDDFETGKISANVFRSKLSEVLNIDVPDHEFDSAWNAMLLGLPEERIQLLKKLGQKYKVFLFSNTNEIHFDAFRRIIANAYGNPDLLESIFDKTYYSHIHGERKPNSIAFEKILEEQSLDPESTLFIDDSIQHIEGAGKLGIQTIHIKNIDILDACKPLLK